MRPDSYYTGLACMNGHAVTGTLEDMPACAARFCSRCGERTISACATCGTHIHGDYVPPKGYLHIVREYEPPAFCHNCGSPYSWTQRGLTAARGLIDESVLEDSDKETLLGSLDALTRDTPETPGAVLRYKRISTKMGEEAVGALKSILIALVTDAARRQLFQ